MTDPDSPSIAEQFAEWAADALGRLDNPETSCDDFADLHKLIQEDNR